MKNVVEFELTWKDKMFGIFSVLLYASDFISDIVVAVLLYSNCHYKWAAVSASLLAIPVIFGFFYDLANEEKGILHALKYAITLPYGYGKDSWVTFGTRTRTSVSQTDWNKLKWMQICEILGESLPQLIFTSFVVLTHGPTLDKTISLPISFISLTLGLSSFFLVWRMAAHPKLSLIHI